jgi:hypothetical protein
VMSILQSLSNNLCFFHTTCLASRLSGALTAAVYRKVSGAAMTLHGCLDPAEILYTLTLSTIFGPSYFNKREFLILFERRDHPIQLHALILFHPQHQSQHTLTHNGGFW